MFGYVIVNAKSLTPEAQARYQASYCGLCRRLGKWHGLLGRLTLSYDLTFLNLLLSSLYEGETPCESGCGTCPIHPVKKRCWRAAGPTDYCADMSVALHFYSAADKWHDDHNLLALPVMGVLQKKRRAAEARWPRQCEAMKARLAELSRLEAENCQDLDHVSECFGQLMAELFDYRQDRWAPELRAIGAQLGKFIYLLDAYDDLARDKKRGAYNPLAALSETPEYEAEIHEILELLMGRCAAAFERLPCVDDVDILRNILYSGVWLRYTAKAPAAEVERSFGTPGPEKRSD